MLKKGDRLQASEKAWGAITHKLKQIADLRGLSYSKHGHARRMLEEIIKGGPDEDKAAIRTGFVMAEGLHRNFYNDVQHREDLGVDLYHIKKALDLLAKEQGRWRTENPLRRQTIGKEQKPNRNPRRTSLPRGRPF